MDGIQSNRSPLTGQLRKFPSLVRVILDHLPRFVAGQSQITSQELLGYRLDRRHSGRLNPRRECGDGFPFPCRRLALRSVASISGGLSDFISHVVQEPMISRKVDLKEFWFRFFPNSKLAWDKCQPVLRALCSTDGPFCPFLCARGWQLLPPSLFACRSQIRTIAN